MNRRLVLIAGGEIKDYRWHKKIIKTGDLIICANGGLAHALKMGLKPALVVGDLDSLLPAQKKIVSEKKIKLLRHPAGEDSSDLELALDYGLAVKPKEIIILGALGGKRLDHLLANLFLLAKPLKEKIPAKIADCKIEAGLYDENFKIKGSPGDYLSLFALSATVENVVTEGLKYPLKGEALKFSSSLGLSNEFVQNLATVSFHKGLILAIKTLKEPL